MTHADQWSLTGADSATSPDGNIRAAVVDRAGVQVTFRPGTFGRYLDVTLADQLALVLAAAWQAFRRRGREDLRRSLRLSVHEFVRVNEPPDDPRQRRYAEQVRALECAGCSGSGSVRVRTRGMEQWDVEIAPGTTGNLGERAFVTELHEAVSAMLADREVKVTLLKAWHFDLGLPAAWRDLTRDLLAAQPR